MKKTILIICLLLTLCITLLGCNNPNNNETGEGTSIISIINEIPAFFVVDEDNEVVTVTPESEDSEIILAGEDYKGLSIDQAIEKYLSDAKKCGYDLKNKLEVQITSSLSEENVNKLKDKVSESTNKCLETLTGLKDQCAVKLTSIESWFNELKENGYELTEEQKENVDAAWNKVKSYVSQAKYYSSEKLQELYDAYQEKEIDKKVQDTYTEIVEKAKETLSEEKINDFKNFIQEQKDKYLDSEKARSTSKELLAKAKAYLDEQASKTEEKKAKLDELQAKWQAEIDENTEKYGEDTAKLMAAGTKVLVEAAKVALDAAKGLYDAANKAYEQAKEKYSSTHNGDELSLKNLVGDIKESTNKYLEEHPEIKAQITDSYETIKAKVQEGMTNLKAKFEEEYKTEIEEYKQKLIEKKNELLNKNNNNTEE